MKQENKKITGFNLIEVIIIIIICCSLSILATGVIMINNQKNKIGTSYADMLNDENIKEFLDTYAQVTNGYYQDVDKSKLIDNAISSMMDYLGDQYSTYLNTNDTSSLNRKLAGTQKGIGVTLLADGKVKEVQVDSPAAEAGIKEEDKIIAVNDEDTTNLTGIEIAEKIKNSKDSVNLKIERQNQIIEKNVEIKDIVLPSIQTQIISYNNINIGYLKITTFSSNLSSQVDKALTKLEKENIHSLIIDLRGNSGGFLSAATETANLFLERDKIIYTLEEKNNKTDIKDTTDEHRNYPIAVLIDGKSASASEILAAALKYSYNATLVGSVSYGKGKIQQTHSLSDGTMVKYTSATWLTPEGNCIDGIGLIPDYSVPTTDSILKNFPTNDTIIAKAIEVLIK